LLMFNSDCHVPMSDIIATLFVFSQLVPGGSPPDV
jgi:hypothetical protein